VIAVLQLAGGGAQQLGEAALSLQQRQSGQVLAIEVQQIEQEVDERRGIAWLRGGLNHVE
jgi:hypothetical protein